MDRPIIVSITGGSSIAPTSFDHKLLTDMCIDAIEYVANSQFNAIAPVVHLKKNIDIVVPHKSFNKRGKFKRSSK